MLSFRHVVLSRVVLHTAAAGHARRISADQRLTLELKCSGLDAEQLTRRSVPPSTMSLLGLVRHLAGVEQAWFRQRMAGQDVSRHYRTESDRTQTSTAQ